MGDGACRRYHRWTVKALADAARGGRRDHRRRQLPLPRRHPPRGGVAADGHPLRRLRHERRRVRAGARVLPDDRRRGRGRSTGSSPIFARSRPASATYAHARAGAAIRRQAEHGYLHCGPNGAGHFVKMVHNGIEYGLMAAYAEGLNILQHANAGKRRAGRRRRDRTAGAPRALPVRHRRRRKSPRCGGAAASSRRGCSTSPPTRCSHRRRSRSSPAGSPTPAKAAGRRSRRSTRACRRRCSRGALLALRFSWQRRLREQGALGDAQGVRRPRREDVLSASRS